MTQPSVIDALGLSPNGRFVVTGDELGVARVFELAAGAMTAEVKVPAPFRSGSDKAIRRAWVSNDGARVLLQIRYRSTLLAGEVKTWKPRVHDGDTSSRACLSPSGVFAAQVSVRLHRYVGERDTLDLWERNASATDCAISSEGVLVAAFDRRKPNDGPTPDVGILRAFSKDGKPIARLELDDDFHGVRIGFAGPRTVLVVTEKTARLHRWNLDSPRKVVSSQLSKKRLPTFELLAGIGHVALEEAPGKTVLQALDTGKRTLTTACDLWACSEDGTIVLTAEQGSIVRRAPVSLEPVSEKGLGRLTGVAFSADGASLWGGDSTSLTNWSLDTGEVLLRHHLPKGFQTQTIATSGSTALLRSERVSKTLDLASGTLGAAIAATHRIPAISDDGALVATHDPKGDSVVWSAATGKPVTHYSRPTKTFYGRAFDPKGKLFVTCDEFGATRLWDAKRASLLSEFTTPNRRSGWGLAISRDGKSLLLGGDASLVHLFALPSGRVKHALKGLKGQGDCRAAFSPNGKWIAVGNEQSAVVWAAANGKRVLLHEGPAYSIAFAPDSKRFAVGGVGEVVVFDL